MKKTPFVTLEKVQEIAEEYPTPFHLDDEKGIRENAQALKLSLIHIFFITHDIAVMRKVADRLIVMKEGRFLGEGTYEELLAEQKEGYIRELIGASFIFKP